MYGTRETVAMDIDWYRTGGKVVARKGTPCTLHVGSDSYPKVIVAMERGGMNMVLGDLNGDGSGTDVATFRPKAGGWRLRGSKRGASVLVGIAQHYMDPSF